MKLKLFLAAAVAAILFSACNSKENQEDKVTESVRSYFFLDDSVQVVADVIDTLYADELEQMLETIQENQRLVQLDIDTLGSMIDDLAYDEIEGENELYEQKIKLLEYQLKYEQLKAKQLEFQQNERVFLGLKRASWADIAGFNVQVNFNSSGEDEELVVLMDGNYRIVD